MVHEICTYVQQSDCLDARLNTLVTRPKVLELAREGPTSLTYITSLLIDSFSVNWQRCSMGDAFPLQKWSNKERPSICLDMGDTKDTDQMSAAQYPFLRWLHLYRWRNCSWWSCVSWARYAKVPRAFMGLIVPCCWAISVLHGSIFPWMQAGRQKFCKIVPNQILPAIWVSFA